MIHKLLKRPQAIIGLCLIAIVIVIAIAAPAFSPHDPELVNLSQKYAQPDAEYPLGTDQLGRCTLSRLLYGARYSIGISLPVLLILSVIGLIVGTFSACAGEKADHFITILCDVFIAFPSLIIAIAVIGVLGNGLQNIAVSVVIATWLGLFVLSDLIPFKKWEKIISWQLGFLGAIQESWSSDI